MYGPSPFLLEDTEIAMSLIEDIVMGTLIVPGDKLEGSPLPFMACKKSDGGLRLIGHMDRANPLWKDLEIADSVLVIFWGPNTYVSPSYYVTSPRVPTWVYATVHVTGKAKLIQDADALSALVSDLSNFLEPEGSGWCIGQVADYKEKLLSGIVGFEIEANTTQSQVRILQTNSKEDRAAVYKALVGGTNAEQQVAELMKKNILSIG